MIKIICPSDPTIKRLERHAWRTADAIKDCKVTIVRPGDASKVYGQREIWDSGKNDLIVFMGHGRSDALYGSKGRLYASADLAGDSALCENLDLYNDDSFIDSSNYGLFAGKKAVIFACKSAELGRKLCEAGATVVLGFGKLPTSQDEFIEDWSYQVSNHAVAAMSGILDVSFCNALIDTIKMQGTFFDMQYQLRMQFQRSISMLLYSKACYRYKLASTLYSVAASIKVLGDRYARLV